MLCTTRSSGPRITSPDFLRQDPSAQLDIELVSNTIAPSDAQVLLDLYNHTLNPSQDIPSFFEQVMMCDMETIGPDAMQPPPNLTTWMPEAEWFGAVDLFGNEFAPTVDQTLEDQQVLNQFFATPAQDRDDTEVPESTALDDGARKRHAIFQQSSW